MNLFLRAGIAISVLTLLIVGHTTTGVAEAGDFLPTEKQCSSLENPDAKTKGWCVAINRRQGNCLACHIIVTDKWPTAFPPGGSVAPPLVAMQQRYPDKAKLRAQIYDAQSVNPQAVMPPFGKHKIISEKDIDNIVEFLLSI